MSGFSEDTNMPVDSDDSKRIRLEHRVCGNLLPDKVFDPSTMMLARGLPPEKAGLRISHQ